MSEFSWRRESASRPDSNWQTGLEIKGGKRQSTLAAMTAEQREAVATYIETARPWLEPGLDSDSRLTIGDFECYLGIIAEELRLQRGRDLSPTMPTDF